jgi:hypothetical protein
VLASLAMRWRVVWSTREVDGVRGVAEFSGEKEITVTRIANYIRRCIDGGYQHVNIDGCTRRGLSNNAQ